MGRGQCAAQQYRVRAVQAGLIREGSCRVHECLTPRWVYDSTARAEGLDPTTHY